MPVSHRAAGAEREAERVSGSLSSMATKQSTSTALAAMAGVVIASFVVAALYLGREILIPLALTMVVFVWGAKLVQSNRRNQAPNRIKVLKHYRGVCHSSYPIRV